MFETALKTPADTHFSTPNNSSTTRLRFRINGDVEPPVMVEERLMHNSFNSRRIFEPPVRVIPIRILSNESHVVNNDETTTLKSDNNVRKSNSAAKYRSRSKREGASASMQRSKSVTAADKSYIVLHGESLPNSEDDRLKCLIARHVQTLNKLIDLIQVNQQTHSSSDSTRSEENSLFIKEDESIAGKIIVGSTLSPAPVDKHKSQLKLEDTTNEEDICKRLERVERMMEEIQENKRINKNKSNNKSSCNLS